MGISVGNYIFEGKYIIAIFKFHINAEKSQSIHQKGMKRVKTDMC